MRYLIKNGTIIDPANRVATIGDILVANGKVERLYDMARSPQRPRTGFTRY
jgi:dihydroorotase